MRKLALLLLLLVASPVAAQTATPEPPPITVEPLILPTIPMPTQEMFEQMATANASLADLPADLTRPDGVPILPSGNGSIVFGYVKWLLSPATIDEWLGPFAPIFQHFFIGIAMMFPLMAAYVTLYTIANIGGWVAWIVEQARRYLDLVLQFVQASPLLVIASILFFIAAAIFGQEGVRAWNEDGFDGLVRWFFCLLVVGSCAATGGVNP